MGGWPLRALRALERDEPMLTLCLPAAGIQEEEAVAIGGREGGMVGKRIITNNQLYIKDSQSILFQL